jgi:endonuclease YncB( thermonuclease family)
MPARVSNKARNHAEAHDVEEHGMHRPFEKDSTTWMLPALTLCIIIAIGDGDSLTARCENAGGVVNLKMRLAEIDAPERRQPFRTRSRQHLAALCSAGGLP